MTAEARKLAQEVDTLFPKGGYAPAGHYRPNNGGKFGPHPADGMTACVSYGGGAIGTIINPCTVLVALASRPAVEAKHVRIEHDGFEGDVIGSYVTREGKRGVVVQQDGTRVVHVYGEKWIGGSNG